MLTGWDIRWKGAKKMAEGTRYQIMFVFGVGFREPGTDDA